MNFNFPPQLLPTISFIVIGYIAKYIGLLKKEFAPQLIKFAFQLILPLVITICFAKTKLGFNLLTIPLISILVSSTLMLIAFFVGKTLKFSSGVLGGYLAASGVTSTLVFALPFVQSAFGEEGARYVYLYDFGNAIMCYFVVYIVCSFYGKNKTVSVKESLLIFFKTPCVIAVILGFYLSTKEILLHPGIILIYDKATTFFNVLLLLCIGLLVDFSYFLNRKNLLRLLICSSTIMLVSILLANILADYFELNGVCKDVVLLCAFAPAASIGVAFAIEHELDIDFTSALVAFTMAIGTIAYPIFFFLTKN